MPGHVIHLLQEDPDLGEQMDPVSRRQAAQFIRATVHQVPKGCWQPPEIGPGATGLLLLEGLMARTLALGPVSSCEIVGPSDIIRPWEDDLLLDAVPTLTRWRVLEAAQVALLDARVTMLIGRWPRLSAAVAGRLLRRTRSLAYLMAAQHFVRVEDRLLATLWHLASMWGRVTPRGTVVPFRLTHEMLAGIVGAQRPTTTMAVRSLTEQGRLLRDDDRRYVLLGDPPDWRAEPAEVLELQV